MDTKTTKRLARFINVAHICVAVCAVFVTLKYGASLNSENAAG